LPMNGEDRLVLRLAVSGAHSRPERVRGGQEQEERKWSEHRNGVRLPVIDESVGLGGPETVCPQPATAALTYPGAGASSRARRELCQRTSARSRPEGEHRGGARVPFRTAGGM